MKPEVRESLSRWLDENLDSPQPHGKYWFPLTQPTYGKDEIAAAIEHLCDFRTSMSVTTREFETAFARHVGAHDAVMVNSGSSADLLLAFNLANPNNPRLQQGDEVLIPAVTWPTQVWSPMMAGLKVKLVDVDPTTLNVDFDDLRRQITPRTKCFFAVHLMGNPCDMQQVQEICNEHDLLLIEDCCESLGALHNDQHVGTFGLGGSFSFFFSHHMTTMEGGMVTCESEEDAQALRVLRAHGWSRDLDSPGGTWSEHEIDSRYRFVNWGFNVRPTELQAAFGLQQLQKVDWLNQRRRVLASRFYDYVDSSPYLTRFSTHDGATSSPFALVLQLQSQAADKRGELTTLLEKEGVETRPVVTGNLARQPAAKLLGDINPADFPGAEQIHRCGFYMGLSPMFDEALMDKLIATLDRSLASVIDSPIRRAA